MQSKFIPVLLIVFVLALGGSICGRRSGDELPGHTGTLAAAEETFFDEAESSGTETMPADRVVWVYICGHVRCPGVYSLPEGARVVDAVDAAGGFAEDADTEYWNLAGFLQDGQQIRVPSMEESREPEPENSGSSSDGRVNLNTADETELSTLTGIGPSRARAIIAYREENGPFRSIEDIMNVSGIKEASFAKIKDFITVG